MAEGDSDQPPPREIRLPRYRGLRFATSFKWLCAGAVIYALLLLAMIAGDPSEILLPFLGPSFYLTPAFGAPLVVLTFHRPGRIRRLIYFCLLLPLVHSAAIYLAWSYGVSNALDPQRAATLALECGAIAGVAGAALSFALFHLARLGTRPRAELATMGLATVALTALGALGMAAGVLWSGVRGEDATSHAGQLIIWLECVHLPWQLLFALVLAWLMRRSPEHRRARRKLATTTDIPAVREAALSG